jgi:hypothetical protein
VDKIATSIRLSKLTPHVDEIVGDPSCGEVLRKGALHEGRDRQILVPHVSCLEVGSKISSVRSSVT